jgi:hypothetical protein
MSYQLLSCMCKTIIVMITTCPDPVPLNVNVKKSVKPQPTNQTLLTYVCIPSNHLMLCLIPQAKFRPPTADDHFKRVESNDNETLQTKRNLCVLDYYC